MNHTRSEILANLSEFVCKVAVIPPDEIIAQDSLDTLGIDSAAIISLSAHLEEQYGVVADAEDLPKSSTLEQIADFVIREREG
ncbi:MAG: acyl carrier protein [bacterium]|nr:acyl carrier protein [bacterium]